MNSNKWQKQNYEHRKEYLKQWHKENIEKVKKQREDYKDIKNKKRREKYKNDEEYKKKRLIESKKWQENNPDKRKNQRLKQYGISFDEFNLLLIKANNKCQICGYDNIDDKKIFPVIDHCHNNGNVRGILCSKCNLALGHFNDSIENLENAIKYLKEIK